MSFAPYTVAVPDLPSQFIAFQQNERLASPYTLRNYAHSLREFERYYGEAYSKKLNWSAVTTLQARDTVIELQRVLDRRTVHNRIAALRSFYRWGVRLGHLTHNPFKNITLPKAARKLPVFLTEAQMQKLLAAPSQRQANGHAENLSTRDELILELLYGAGLRVSELCDLRWQNVSYEQGLIKVLGKGRKERLCPCGEIAMSKLRAWQKLTGESEGPVFPRLSPRTVQLMLKENLRAADLPLSLTPHKLRHTFATHMVGRGANLRAVQELMGHKSLTTTQIYAHLTLGKVKEAYQKAHPRA